MTTKESLEKYIGAKKKKGYGNPIFALLFFEHPDKELVYQTGEASGFPDLGASYEPGFFYDLDEAIRHMHNNTLDIHECMYDAGFILCRFPGLYQNVGPGKRMYFTWDDEKKGFYQQEEPKIFAKFSF